MVLASAFGYARAVPEYNATTIIDVKSYVQIGKKSALLFYDVKLIEQKKLYYSCSSG